MPNVAGQANIGKPPETSAGGTQGAAAWTIGFPLLLGFCIPTAASGQSDPGVMARYRALTSAERSDACVADRSSDEVVVCGNRDDDRYRIGEVDAATLERAGNARGERDTLLQAGGRCSGTVGLHGNAGCGGGLNVIAIGRAVGKAIDAIKGE